MEARRVLIAHPSPDLYGSDLQMVSASDGLLARGWHVSVVLPTEGPLLDRLRQRPSIDVRVRPFPVLRRAAMNPLGLVKLLVEVLLVLPRLVRLIRRERPDVVYVNTVTIPWWVIAARLARRPVVVHVREAEEAWPLLVRILLTAPLLLATRVVTNSRASRRVLLDVVARLAKRSEVIYNGIAGPAGGDPTPQLPSGGTSRLALVARLSPRKGVDVALEAVALLRARGYDVVLDVCGTAYAGYEWFEKQLRDRAAQPDLEGAIEFHGYVNPTWPMLSSSSVVLIPSLVEPFGNTAVEGLLAARPVVASEVQGLAEIITDDRTGLLVPPGDAGALAAAVQRVLDDPQLARRLVEDGLAEAHERFSVERYREDIDAMLGSMRRRGRRRAPVAASGDGGQRRVLIAHPSPDLYGSDRQLLEVAEGLLASGHEVHLYVSAPGPLVPLLEDAGVRVTTMRFPVLRRAMVSPPAFAWLLASLPVALFRLLRVVRRVRPDVVYVNTVTIPWWLVAARAAGVPSIVHVHEAEEGWPGAVRWLLSAPLMLASAVVTNSQASQRVLVDSVASIEQRSEVVYNGMSGPDAVTELAAPGPDDAARLALVARLSPRKGVDVALEAVALLRAQGRRVELDVCGTAFAGYEWFEEQLRDRAARPDLAGAVQFLGYVNPTWPLLDASRAVLVPSRVEPFGNTAVEGLLAGRPVIASRVQGLAEIVTDGRTGLLVPPGDAAALAAAITRLLDDPQFAAELAAAGRAEALERFGVPRYRSDIEQVVERVITR